MMVAPSLLAADFANLQRDIEFINRSKADWFHVDVMDGMFVPNISFGTPIMEILQTYSQKPLDVHLMIEKPSRYLKHFMEFGANILTIHYEASNHLHRDIQEIKSLGVKAGVALNPHTPINVLESIIGDVDLVCLMSVNPGFGGQKFIEHTFQKIRDLKTLVLKKQAKVLIEIDGGVSSLNARRLADFGADVLVAGSAIFKSQNPEKEISLLKEIIR